MALAIFLSIFDLNSESRCEGVKIEYKKLIVLRLQYNGGWWLIPTIFQQSVGLILSQLKNLIENLLSVWIDICLSSEEASVLHKPDGVGSYIHESALAETSHQLTSEQSLSF